MIGIIIVFTLVCVAFEITAVRKIPMLLHILERYPLAALVFSLVLSVLLGALFGAAGLTVFVAGMVSTFLVQPYYRLEKRGSIDKVRVHIATARAKYDAKHEVYVKRGRQLIRGFMLVWKIIMVPFIVIGAMMDRIDEFTSVVKKIHKHFSRNSV